MAKDNSFDVVSETDMQEVANAVNNANKALQQRYDLKGSGATLELDKAANTITVTGPSDFVCSQVEDVLSTHLVRRKIDLKSVKWGEPHEAAGSTVRVVGTISQGIEQDLAKKIGKDIRDAKFKAKVTIEGDKLKVSSPKRDELQAVIAFLREKDYGVPLQYVNYR